MTCLIHSALNLPLVNLTVTGGSFLRRRVPLLAKVDQVKPRLLMCSKLTITAATSGSGPGCLKT